MDIQRLRNLTTGRLHTSMDHIYADIEHLTGESGIMTHQLPNACRAMQPWLKAKLTDARLWDGQYDPTHTGEVEITPMTDAERSEMFSRYAELPSPLASIGSGS